MALAESDREVTGQIAANPAAEPASDLTSAERRLRCVLRWTAFGLFIASAIYTLGPLVGPAREFFRELPFVSNSVVKVTILGLACLYAAGDIRRRIWLVGIVIAAHVVSLAAMGSMLIFADTSSTAALGFADPTMTTVLWGAIGLDGLITALIAAFFVAAWRSTRGLRPPEPDLGALTPSERLLRTLLWIFVALFAAGAVAYELGPFVHSTEGFARELPFVTNSVVKTAALAMICGYAALHLRRNMALVGPVVAVQLLAVLVQLAYLIHQTATDPDRTVSVLGASPRLTTILWIAIIADSLIPTLILGLAYRSAWRRRYQLSFLSPASYRALAAAAEVCIVGGEAAVSPRDIASRVESFLEDFRARRRWLYQGALTGLQLAPLIELRPIPRVNPPLSELDPASRRRFLFDHYERLPRQSGWRFAKNLKQIVIRICLQLSYAGFYGDPRTYSSIGYKPFTQRPRYAELEIEEPGIHPLEVELPGDIGEKRIETEICIVGSGAAGSILAYELAACGRDVLVLERGRYVEPRHFNENEIDMISRLYADGLMQQTEDWRFTVLQGNCVGGSTTVNNAVCFRPPPSVLERWNDPLTLDAGLDLGELNERVSVLEQWLSIVEQAPDVQLNPAAERFLSGAATLPAGELDVDVVRANINGCYGSGYCNMGCPWGKKLSMLETALPRAQSEFPGRVRIVAECEVERIQALSGSPEHVTGLRAKLSDGRPVSIAAKKYVLSAGAVGSSYLLIRSGLGRRLPVGERFSANMGAPLTAEYEQVQDAYDGLQISHYGIPCDDGYVFETWFNPPVAQALNMPGWFEDHAQNMLRYNHLMSVGVLVGTASNGQVRRALLGGPGVAFRPTPTDLATLARGLKQLGRILFRGDQQPLRLMINTWGKEEFNSEQDLDRLDEICQDPDYIALGTGHPQGGNVISRDPKRGVVDPNFQVHGYDNLYICDASVFPTSLTVNPQLTVMGLAHYAAPRID